MLRVKAKGHRDLVTVAGALASVNAGEWVTAQGNWVQDREYGLQFKATVLKSSPPSSREGIEKYLGSGLIKGIGPVYAKKLVEKFGENIFTVIDRHSVQLEEVDGIGPGRRQKIKAAWAEQKAVREIMIFLHSHGVSTSRAARIYKAYGENAIETVRANPYILGEGHSWHRIQVRRHRSPDAWNRSRLHYPGAGGHHACVGGSGGRGALCSAKRGFDGAGWEATGN